MIAEAGFGDGRMSAGLSKLIREPGGTIFGFDTDTSNFTDDAKTRLDFAVPEGTQILIKKGDVFSRKARHPSADVAQCNPPYEDNMLKWAMLIHSWC